MMFGDRTDQATSASIIDKGAATRASTFYRGRLHQGRVRAHRRGHRSRRTGATGSFRHQGRPNVMISRRTTAASRGAGCRAACDDSLARPPPTPSTSTTRTRDDPDTPLAETIGALGDLTRRAARSATSGVELPRLAHRQALVAECEAGVPAPVVCCQPHFTTCWNPHARGRDPVRVRDYYGLGVASYSPWRAAHRQVRTGRAAARGFARGAAATAASTRPRCARSRSIAQKLSGTRAEDRPRRCSSRSRGCGPIAITSVIARAAHHGTVGRVLRARSARRWNEEDEKLVDSSCRPATLPRSATTTRNARSSGA